MGTESRLASRESGESFVGDNAVVQEKRREEFQRVELIGQGALGRVDDYATAAEEYYSGLHKQLHELREKIIEIGSSPMVREEFREMIKAKMAVFRKELIVDDVLLPALRLGQTRSYFPFEVASMRVNLISPEKAWRLGYLVLTDDLIDAACEQLPDTGMTSAQKTEAQAKIRAEMDKIEKKLAAPPPKEIFGYK
jgi:hypothetical protein